jgi:hypothetical protein
MDAHDELRAALSRQRDAEDADTRVRRRAAEDAAQYKREVEELETRLNEIAQLTIQALADSDEPTSIEVEPKRGFFGKPILAYGWEVTWRAKKAIACPDGTLLTSAWRANGPQYEYTSFKEVIEKRITQIGAESGGDGPSPWERAFEGQGDMGAATSLRSRLGGVQSEMVRDLSRILSHKGLSV